MRVPIQYALTYPERVAGPAEHLDLVGMGRLSFEPVDMARYPAFGLIRAGRPPGGTYPAAVSAANDVAVDQFVAGRIGFTAIAETLAATLDAHELAPGPDARRRPRGRALGARVRRGATESRGLDDRSLAR